MRYDSTRENVTRHFFTNDFVFNSIRFHEGKQQHEILETDKALHLIRYCIYYVKRGLKRFFFQSYPTGWTVYAIGTLLNEVLYMALSSFGNHLRLYFVNYTLVHKFTFIHPIDPLISQSASRSVDTFTNDA